MVRIRIVSVAVVKLETWIVGLSRGWSYRCVEAVFYACIVHHSIILAADAGVSGLGGLERSRTSEPDT